MASRPVTPVMHGQMPPGWRRGCSCRVFLKWLLLSALSCLAVLVFRCAPNIAAEIPTIQHGKLIVRAQPADAMLFVDDRYVGTIEGLKARAILIALGRRRIELRRKGYFAHYAEVWAKLNHVQRLQIQLRKRPF